MNVAMNNFELDEKAAVYHGNVGREFILTGQQSRKENNMKVPDFKQLQRDIKGRELELANPPEAVSVAVDRPRHRVILWKVKQYINTLAPIIEEKRDTTLYEIRGYLRANFTLTDDALEHALSVVNKEKCNPPLPESAVIMIAQSAVEAEYTSSIREIAQQFTEWRLNTIPPAKGKKCPCGIWDAESGRYVWKPYQDRFSTNEEWSQWEENGHTRIGIVAGQISGNLLIFDFDQGGKALDAFKAKISPELWSRFVVEQTPSGGWHIYVRSKELVGGNETLAWELDVDYEGKWKKLIETRAEGGYCICAPSEGYVLQQGNFGDIPTLESAEIEFLLDVARSFNQKPSPPAVISHPVASSVVPANMAEAERRAIAYINAMPEAIEGYNGSADALRVCNKLFEFGIDQNSAKQIFTTYYNPRCKPQWSEKEIDHKLDTAYSKPLKPAGSMLDSHIAATASPAWQPFPVDCLPPVLRNFVVEGAQSYDVDPAHFVAPMFPSIASAIGSRYILSIKEDWSVPPILWAALIADSGSNKTAVIEKVIEPLKMQSVIADDLYQVAEEKYKIDKVKYETDLAAWRAKRKRKPIESGEPPTPPTQPVRTQYLVMDITTEALIEVLAENPDGLLQKRDELAGFFGGFDAYRAGSNKDESFYNEMFDGYYSKNNRKGNDKKVLAAKHTYCSITGGIQPEIFKMILKAHPGFLYSGLFARFLLTMPPVRVRKFLDSSISESVKESYRQLYKTLFLWRHTTGMSPDCPYRIEMTNEARSLFVENYDRLSQDYFSQTAVMKAFLSKMAGITGRIALVLHIAEFVSQHHNWNASGNIPMLEKATMDNAIQIAHWFIEQELRVLHFLSPQGHVHADFLDHEAMAILEVIREKGEITKDELHNLQVFKKVDRAAKVIEEKLSELKRHEIIVSEFVKHPRGGRGKEVYRLASAAVGGETIENTNVFEGSTSTVSESTFKIAQSTDEKAVDGGTIENPSVYRGSTSTVNENVFVKVSQP